MFQSEIKLKNETKTESFSIIHEHEDKSSQKLHHVSTFVKYFPLDHLEVQHLHKPICLPHTQELK